MQINTFQLATEGIGPGFTTYSLATVGYLVEIVPVPVPPGFVFPQGGGGTGSGNIATSYGYVPYNKREKLRIKVSRNGREWEEEFEEIDIPSFLKEGESESVEASFLSMQTASASATFIKYMINTDNVIIKVKKI